MESATNYTCTVLDSTLTVATDGTTVDQDWISVRLDDTPQGIVTVTEVEVASTGASWCTSFSHKERYWSVAIVPNY